MSGVDPRFGLVRVRGGALIGLGGEARELLEVERIPVALDEVLGAKGLARLAAGRAALSEGRSAVVLGDLVVAGGEVFATLHSTQVAGEELLHLASSAPAWEELKTLRPLQQAARSARGLAHELNNVMQLVQSATHCIIRIPSNTYECTQTILRALRRSERAVERRRLVFRYDEAMEIELDELTRCLSTVLEDSHQVRLSLHADHAPGRFYGSIVQVAFLLSSFVGAHLDPTRERALSLRTQTHDGVFLLSFTGLKDGLHPLVVQELLATTRVQASWDAERAEWRLELPLHALDADAALEAEVGLITWGEGARLQATLESHGCGVIPCQASNIDQLLRDYGDEIDVLLIDGRRASEIELEKLYMRLEHAPVKSLGLGCASPRLTRSADAELSEVELIAALRALSFS